MKSKSSVSSIHKKTSRSWKSRAIVVVATGFYFGKSPVMPGTAGTILALPFCMLLSELGATGYFLFTAGFIYFAMAVAQKYENEFRRHDSPEVVIDEVAGFLVSMLLLPMEFNVIVSAFVGFRILDMWKPFPISFFDRKVPGGYGVVMDDVVAGLITNIILQFVIWRSAWLGSH